MARGLDRTNNEKDGGSYEPARYDFGVERAGMPYTSLCNLERRVVNAFFLN
jgi:hypothetical protein